MKLTCSLILCGALSLAGGQDGQTIRGVLMDASCEAIAKTSVPAGAPNADSIRNNSASVTGTTGTADTTGATAGRADIPAVAPVAGAHAEEERNRIGDTTSGAATVADAASGPSSASALGTTGAATEVAPSTGERNRSADKGRTTVREKYAQCKPTATTTSFAIHADGELYVLDQAGNDMVRQQMSGEAFRAAMAKASRESGFMTVTVVGTPGAGNSLTITSVRK